MSEKLGENIYRKLDVTEQLLQKLGMMAITDIGWDSYYRNWGVATFLEFGNNSCYSKWGVEMFRESGKDNFYGKIFYKYWV